MKAYIKITFELTDNSLSDILIAQLSQYGFEGFEEEPDSLSAFISEERLSPEDLEKISVANGLAYTKTIIPPKNWNEEWEKNYEPVTVDDFCGIRASFHPPFKGLKHEIIITPKMSFGTGHHATTFLMIRAISTLDCKGKTVLDFGTGTGALAILAKKCGAEKIIAIDNDDWSIENATENMRENDCSKIILIKDNSIAQAGNVDIILANISKNVILRHLHSFKQHLTSSGVLLLSGLLNTDYDEVEKEVRRNDFSIFSKQEKENWICLILKAVQATL
jgi:ribosomal protein L11 methyltransferase